MGVTPTGLKVQFSHLESKTLLDLSLENLLFEVIVRSLPLTFTWNWRKTYSLYSLRFCAVYRFDFEVRLTAGSPRGTGRLKST